MKKRLLVSLFGWFAVLILPGAMISAAEEPDAGSVEKLNQEIQELLQRVEKLEASQKSNPSWVDRVTLKGDFRYRYEQIDDDRRRDVRYRQRIRFRFFVGAEITDDLDLGLQLATGDDDPVSTNQTLGDAFSTKDTRLDLAFMDYHPFNQARDDLDFQVVAGKMYNPFEVMSKTELLWDPDLNPEGIAASIKITQDHFSVFGHTGFFQVEERGSASDSLLCGAQAGVNLELGEKAGDLTAGAGYYYYSQLEGNPVLYDDDPAGNSAIPTTDTDGDGLPDADFIYLGDYENFEVFAEYAIKVEEIPVHFFGNWTKNNVAFDSTEDTGWLAGFKVGSARQPGQFDFRWQWKELGKDAVLGTFTDSDFGGGGADVKGMEFNVDYAIAKNWTFGVTYFINEVNVSTPFDEDYERLQVDMKFKF